MNERERIELIMKSYGLTPSQFADRTGIQRASVSHIISGRNKPSLEVLQKIFETFPELDVKWLMTGQGELPVADATNEHSQLPASESNLFAQPQPNELPNKQQQPLLASHQANKEPVRQLKQQGVVQRQQTERAPRKSSPQRNALQSDNKKIREIRVYYTDGTYEILFPEK